MAKEDSKNKAPASAPELTDEDKQRIEAELAVANPVDASGDSDETNQPEDPTALTAETTEPADASDSTDSAAANDAKPHGHRIKRFFKSYWHHKKWTLPLTLLVILGILAAVPMTRYPIAGLVLKHQATVAVIDSATKKPVSSASIAIDGKTYKTDKNGQAVVDKLKVGKHTVAVSKKYYTEASAELFVPLLKNAKKEITVQATGRQVQITVVNKITKAPIEDVTLKASGTEVKTDKEGKAVIVLPADKTDLPITLSGNGYNGQETRVKVTDAVVAENTFSMVSTGKVYFLSRQSGKLDVVKTDLDGTNRQTVVYGTGKEDDRQTVLLASRDWKFLTLYSRRDSGLPKLYLIDTSTDKMTTMDEGDAAFNLLGWGSHNFMYSVTRNNIKPYESNYQAVKKYDADKKQLLTLDQSVAERLDPVIIEKQQFGNFFLTNDKLIYIAQWQAVNNQGYGTNTSGSTRQSTVRSLAVADGAKKDIRNFPMDQYSGFSSRPYEPGSLYIGAYSIKENKNAYYEYEDGKVESITIDDEKFYSQSYPTYLISPDGTKTLWTEQRDGRNVFFVGDTKAENAKQVGSWEDEYQVYGWYTDSYLLVSKKSSELYILPVGGGEPLKVSDYHKPDLSYRGYGGGYGGL